MPVSLHPNTEKNFRRYIKNLEIRESKLQREFIFTLRDSLKQLNGNNIQNLDEVDILIKVQINNINKGRKKNPGCQSSLNKFKNSMNTTEKFLRKNLK